MRSIWSGAISFGLINIPVALFSATTESSLDFDLVHKDDMCPINYARVCRRTGKEIPYNEIVRAYQYKKSSYVVIEDSDFEAANVKKYRLIQIVNFVKQSEIDFVYLEKPYYLRPTQDSDHAYYLFSEILKKTKKVAIGKFILRNREHPCMLSASNNNTMILYQLRFASEIRHPDFEIKKSELSQKEQSLALALIENMSEPFYIDKFKDTYTDDLKKIIDKKIKGQPIKSSRPSTPFEIPDLMKALEKSLERQKAAKK